MPSPGTSQWQLQYQVSPIFLTGGIAANVPGGTIPIVSLTMPGAFPGGLLTGGSNIDLDNCIQFIVPEGGTLVDQQFGEYPFANQSVAANAVIAQSLHISLVMICPVNTEGGYWQKLALISALKQSLDQHNQSGGTYSVLTPAYVYAPCLLKMISNVTEGATKQPQMAYRWDFEKPLLTLQQAAQAQNNLMTKITNQTQISGQPTWSGQQPAVGNPGSGQAPGTIPAAAPLQGATAGQSTAQ